MKKIHLMYVTSGENYPELKKGDTIGCYKINKYCGSGFYIIKANGQYETVNAIQTSQGKISLSKLTVNYFNIELTPEEFSQLVVYKVTHLLKQIDFHIENAAAEMNSYLSAAEYYNSQIEK